MGCEMKTVKIFTALAFISFLGLVSCRQAEDERPVKKAMRKYVSSVKVRNMIDAAEAYDDMRFFAFIDSLEGADVIPSAEANYRRGERYNDHDRQRSTILYLQKALEGNELRDYDIPHYYQAMIDMAAVQSNVDNVNECMRVSTRGYEMASLDTTAFGRDWANMFLQRIGSCQLKLGHDDEAAKTFNMLREKAEALAMEHPDKAEYEKSCLIIANNIISVYLNHRKYSNITSWLTMMEEALKRYAVAETSREKYEKYRSMLICNKAIILAMTGHKKEGEAAYQEYLKTDRAKTYYGIYDQAFYLECSEQWDKLMSVQLTIDSIELSEDIAPPLDYLISSPATLFKAMLHTGRKDEALKKADEIISLLDSARRWQNRNEASELAVIYETQQKEDQIAQQKATLAHQKYTLEHERYITMAIIFAIILVALVIFSLFRYRSAKRLAVAHSQLKEAYDQLEETTTAKERIESELRIARDIQMSMVPNTFPNIDGLDMYAVMTPAREVGGDLYDYLLNDDMLYFCLGDVSGKGVPAAMFMAQTIRLFRAIAKQKHSPATIATRINKELTENNEQGMFVTMFIARLHLDTGKLDFCNAGHNPPVLGGDDNKGDFLEMIPNAPIGLWPELEYDGEEIDNIQGRPLFIYTDGLNEAENPQQQQFGDEHLLEILRDTPFDSSRQVIETLQAAVERHRNGAEPNDDLTMMCVVWS